MTDAGRKKGLVIVNTGPGKGKTTAAFGAALRAAGSGLEVLIVQFIKNRDSGEIASMDRVTGVTVKQFGGGMLIGRQPNAVDVNLAETGLRECRDAMTNGCDLIVLDEIHLALKYGLLSLEEVVNVIRNRPPHVHLILTGRDCPEEIMELADTVTYMDARKHHLQSGVTSQAGVEY